MAKVPDPYDWNTSFSTEYHKIDDDHKGLFAGVKACSEKRNDHAALAKLTKDCQDHFTYEEGQMKKAKYAAYDAHKKLHDDFIGTLKALKGKNLSDGDIDGAKKWLVNHICDNDFKYKKQLPADS